MKKFLKWTGISLGVLFLLLLIAPFLFKGKIIEAVKTAANDNLNAKVNFEDVDLSFIRNFPNLRLTIENLTVDNVAPFDSVRMAQIGDLVVVVNLKSLFGDEIELRKIGIENASFDIRVTPEGVANYDIAKPDTVPAAPEAPSEEGAGFKMKLKEYYVENGKVNYADMSMPFVLKLDGFNHKGSGDFTQDVVNLVTTTHADKGTFWFDGITYVNEARTDIQADLTMDMKNMKFTIGGNEIKLNELILGAQGWVAMPGENIDMDISFKALKSDFKNFLSMVPLEFAKDVSGVDATGNFALDGYVRGTYNETSMPGVGLNMLVENGRFKYPDLPKSVDNIQLKAAIVADMNVMDNTTVDVEKFHLEMAQNPVDMTLKLRTPESDPDIDFTCKAFVDLDNLREFIPVNENDQVHGKIDADVALKGRMSSVENGQYDQFNAQGKIDITNVFFKSDSLPYDMNVNTATFNFTPAYIDLANFSAQMGRSDLAASGKINNYLAYALRDSLLKGEFNLNSRLMDLNEFMTAEPEATQAPAQGGAEAPAPADTSSMAPIELPGNIDFTLNANIGKLIYDKNEITNVNGGIVLRDKIAYLRNLTMNVLEGSVGMSGSYNAQHIDVPKMDFNFDIKDMDINKASTAFVTIEKLAPIARSAYGKFSTKLNMRSDLDQKMMPINPTVNGGGSLSTKSVTIRDFKPLIKIAEVTKIDRLKEQTVGDVNVSFKIVNGVVNVDPFTVKLDGVPAKISGSTNLDGQIDYNMDMEIPFDKFPAGAVNQANSLLAMANAKLGTNLSTGQKLPVKLKITGTVTDPKIATNYGELGKEAASNVKDQLIDAAKDEAAKQLEKAKAEALARAQAEKERLVAEAQKQADRLVSEAQNKAAQAKNEGAKLAQKAKDEAYKAAQGVENSAKNPLEKAAKKLAADKMRKEADSAYNKAIEKTNKEADSLVVSAQNQGNKLVQEANTKGDQMIQNANSQGDQQINKLK